MSGSYSYAHNGHKLRSYVDGGIWDEDTYQSQSLVLVYPVK